MTSRYYDEKWGWGDIIAEDDTYILVRFDSDPWYPKWIRKF